jgi:formate-dependent phosphoribosylglycinamide formyltransferase (GAR transformylase)
MAAGKVILANKTEHGHLITQDALAYEVRLTTKPPGNQWRLNHVVMAVASSVEEAIAMCKAQYPNDPIIDQVVLRNRGMDLILASTIISCER